MKAFGIFKLTVITVAAVWIGVLINSCKQSTSRVSNVEMKTFKIKYLNGSFSILDEDDKSFSASDLEVKKFEPEYIIQADGTAKFNISELVFDLKKVEYTYVKDSYSYENFGFIASYAAATGPVPEKPSDSKDFDKLGLKVLFDQEADVGGFMLPRVRVAAVLSGSAAALKGVSKDYCIEMVNGQNVTSLESYQVIVAKLVPGNVTVTLEGCSESTANKSIQYQVVIASTSSGPTPTPAQGGDPFDTSDSSGSDDVSNSQTSSAVISHTSGFYSRLCAKLGGMVRGGVVRCDLGSSNEVTFNSTIPDYVSKIDEKIDLTDSVWLDKICTSFTGGVVQGSGCSITGDFLKSGAVVAVPFISGKSPSEFSNSILVVLSANWKN